MWARFGSSSDGIYLMNADGSGQHQLLNQGQDPVFAPSGGQITFGGTGIWVANANGSGARRLITNQRVARSSGGVPSLHVELNRGPNGPPHGRRIVAVR